MLQKKLCLNYVWWNEGPVLFLVVLAFVWGEEISSFAYYFEIIIEIYPNSPYMLARTSPALTQSIIFQQNLLMSVENLFLLFVRVFFRHFSNESVRICRQIELDHFHNGDGPFFNRSWVRLSLGLIKPIFLQLCFFKHICRTSKTLKFGPKFLVTGNFAWVRDNIYLN